MKSALTPITNGTIDSGEETILEYNMDTNDITVFLLMDPGMTLSPEKAVKENLVYAHTGPLPDELKETIKNHIRLTPSIVDKFTCISVAARDGMGKPWKIRQQKEVICGPFDDYVVIVGPGISDENLYSNGILNSQTFFNVQNSNHGNKCNNTGNKPYSDFFGDSKHDNDNDNNINNDVCNSPGSPSSEIVESKSNNNIVPNGANSSLDEGGAIKNPDVSSPSYDELLEHLLGLVVHLSKNERNKIRIKNITKIPSGTMNSCNDENKEGHCSNSDTSNGTKYINTDHTNKNSENTTDANGDCPCSSCVNGLGLCKFRIGGFKLSSSDFNNLDLLQSRVMSTILDFNFLDGETSFNNLFGFAKQIVALVATSGICFPNLHTKMCSLCPMLNTNMKMENSIFSQHLQQFLPILQKYISIELRALVELAQLDVVVFDV